MYLVGYDLLNELLAFGISMQVNFGLPFIGFLLVACDSDDGVKAFNTDPSAQITSHEEGRDTDEDHHQVTLTNDFQVSTTEVTQGVFYALMGYHSYDGFSASFGAGDDYPAYYASWDMAADFSNELTQYYNTENGTALQKCYSCSGSGTSVSCTTAVQSIYSCTGFRLLTEAEWEYAARAGSTSAIWTPTGGGEIPSGYAYSSACSQTTWTLSDGTSLGDLGWTCINRSAPYPSGSKEVALLTPNDNRLYDMIGNVIEWTHDTYIASLGTGAASNPVRENDQYHVYRGSAWHNYPYSTRSASRQGDAFTSNTRNKYLGIRIGRSY